MDDEEILLKIDECMDVIGTINCPFSDWEVDFIESIEDQFTEKGFISEKQEMILDKIWNKI